MNEKEFNSITFSTDYVIDDQEKKRIDVLLELIGKNKKVLDLGCRDGTISALIRDYGNEVECVEISDYSIQKAREKGLKVYDANLNGNWAEQINSKYDLVFAGEVIEHLFETDIFLRNIYNVLNPNGETIISTPNLASLGRRILLLLGQNPVTEVTTRSTDAGHLRYFVYPSLKKVIEENGFKVKYFTSDLVNFNQSGSLNSINLAKMFPTLGRSLIVKAGKV